MEQFKSLTIGSIIKKYRKQAGLTQFELAETIEIDEKQLGKIERGVHFPSVPTFLRIIKVLNIDIKVFYTDNAQEISHEETRLMKLIKSSSAKELDLVCRIIEVIKNN